MAESSEFFVKLVTVCALFAVLNEGLVVHGSSTASTKTSTTTTNAERSSPDGTTAAANSTMNPTGNEATSPLPVTSTTGANEPTLTDAADSTTTAITDSQFTTSSRSSEGSTSAGAPSTTSSNTMGVSSHSPELISEMTTGTVDNGTMVGTDSSDTPRTTTCPICPKCTGGNIVAAAVPMAIIIGIQFTFIVFLGCKQYRYNRQRFLFEEIR